MPPRLSPSILQLEDHLFDGSTAKAAAKALKDGGADRLHVDVMDGCAVKDRRFNTPAKARAMMDAAESSDLLLDVHLMVKDVMRYAKMYAGADLISFHPEYAENTSYLMKEIRSFGPVATLVGLAMNPSVSLGGMIDSHHLVRADLILFMTVQAGLGGQRFDKYGPRVLEAMYRLPTYAAEFQIDGGIKPEFSMLSMCMTSGANNIVIGSGITHRCYGSLSTGLLRDGWDSLSEDTKLAKQMLMQTCAQYCP